MFWKQSDVFHDELDRSTTTLCKCCLNSSQEWVIVLQPKGLLRSMVTWKSNVILEKVAVITTQKTWKKHWLDQRDHLLTSPILHRKKKKKRPGERTIWASKKAALEMENIHHDQSHMKEALIKHPRKATYSEILGGNNKQANRSTSLNWIRNPWSKPH